MRYSCGGRAITRTGWTTTREVRNGTGEASLPAAEPWLTRIGLQLRLQSSEVQQPRQAGRRAAQLVLGYDLRSLGKMA